MKLIANYNTFCVLLDELYLCRSHELLNQKQPSQSMGITLERGRLLLLLRTTVSINIIVLFHQD